MNLEGPDDRLTPEEWALRKGLPIGLYYLIEEAVRVELERLLQHVKNKKQRKEIEVDELFDNSDLANPLPEVSWTLTAHSKKLTSEETRFKEESDKIHLAHSFPSNSLSCLSEPRPCPWVRCRHHLASEISEGSLKIVDNWDDGRQTCSLDVADFDGLPLHFVGSFLGVTRERVRQIESRAILKLQKKKDDLENPSDRLMHTIALKLSK